MACTIENCKGSKFCIMKDVYNTLGQAGILGPQEQVEKNIDEMEGCETPPQELKEHTQRIQASIPAKKAAKGEDPTLPLNN